MDEAEALGNDALQIFTHSPSVWRMKPIAPERAAAFVEHRASSSVGYLVVHAMYLLNPGSPKTDLWRKSTDALIEEVLRARLLGAEAVVTHLGAHVGSGLSAGIEQVVRSLDQVRAACLAEGDGGPRLLLENTAGSGTTIGSSFDELAEIFDSLGDSDGFGVCLDSAHAFAAGYDLRTTANVAETLAALDAAVGLGRLGLIHLNDSKYACGARRDRHEHIGLGEIGREGLGALARRAGALGVPVILETPKTIDGRGDADRMNLATVRGLLGPRDDEEDEG